MADDPTPDASAPPPEPPTTQSLAVTPPVPAAAAGEGGAVMSLVDHLGELRSRLFRVIAAVAVASVVGFLAGDNIIAFLKSPIPGTDPLFFTGLGDPFFIRMKIAVVVGIILAMPVILYQLWAFVAPGLTEAERRTVRPWVPLALLFFALGVAIAYVILPYAAQFLLGFQTAELKPLITAGSYFDFVTTLFLAFGLTMEFPIVLFALSRVNILSSQRLRASRRYVILGITVFATVATPGGDLVSPFVLGVTMYVLYEATTWFIARSGH
ncbi:MAG: sec-independent protein translocase protein TatC [Chloroflexota bacterium]|jgi:sec-independent protein translocase protein TatC|nr:sec-independent protein translocase protein TatC [Chloroflexota bacterium]